ncbi:BadF-type ATPase [Polaribacter sp. Hel1_33_78]|uniref:N-acetylglucosamine kinase n=1 Tax=Polaribacter sp. Hel1_33_78 TaxID=1336804 RepID=UPI00087C4787|nr:N-acetylglucosamine kinase [Polaribacter sp. Hel1_33_78]SDT86801.1 BadF-type ATPase [Polaribacter sp. Hel1_33_78]
MILIAESGSTKCDWVLFYSSNSSPKRIRTKGLNPAILKKKELKKIISDNKELSEHSHLVTSIYFFGAGCNTSKSKNKVQLILSSCFKKATSIVEEDTMAAVYATTKTPAVVCILGTGSNCCYFNGKSIHSKAPSLGFLVMDEGSGNYFGKELLKAHYYKQMPEELRIIFKEQFDLKEKNVIKKLYQSKTPNKYLANFAIFLFDNIEHPFMKKILNEGMDKFVENHILQYSKELETVPLHFVGSISFYAKKNIENILNKRGLKGTSFVQRPIDNLIERIKQDHLIS